MVALDLTNTLLENGVAVVAGGGQRLAWDVSDTVGLVSTGGAFVAGILAQTMSNNMMIARAGRAVAISASSTGGWVAAEKMLIPDDTVPGSRISAPSQGRLSSGYSPARQAVYSGARANGVVHRAMIPLDGDVTVL